MSFLLRVCSEEEKLTIYHKRLTPSPVYFGKDKHSIMIGEVFGNATEDELLHAGWETNPDVLSHYKTAVSLISYNSEKCFFCSDIMGMETIYYYQDTERKALYLSDDFGEVVREISPSYKDINKKSIALRLAIGGNLLNDETVVTGIKYMRSGTIAVYDRKMGTLDVRRFQYAAFRNEKKDKNQIVEGLDAALNQTMQDIKKKYDENTVFGIGLSGGLDSRIVLHYAVKNGMKCVCFNCCKERPNLLFRARSVRMAAKIARIYNVPFMAVEWDIDELEQILNKKTRYYPSGTLFEGATDIFKINFAGMPQFDVLLNGGAGGLGAQFFSSHYPEIQFLSEDDMTEFILQDYIWCFDNTFFQKIIKVFNYLLGKEITKRNVINKFVWQRKLYESQKPIIENRIRDFIREVKKNTDYGITEVLFNFRALVIGGGGLERFGAFHSRFGENRSYGIYQPWVVNEGLTWNPELIRNRFILKELICQKASEISMIGEETYAPAPGKKGTSLQIKTAKLVAILDRVITGDGSHIAKKYWKSKKIKDAFWKDYNNECVWFKNILKEQEIDIREKDIFRTNHYTMLNIWDTKRLIDAIERKSF